MSPAVLDIALSELQDRPKGALDIYYENNQRFVKGLAPIDFKDEIHNTIPLKQKGVYLITGGLGGLGIIFAEYLARKVEARLILTGRSEISPAKQMKRDEIESLGAEVLYLQADITDSKEVLRLIHQIKSRYPELNGIVHSAGIHQDAFIVKKTKEEIASVLDPKIYGTLNLDKATQDESLDFFVLFSSIIITPKFRTEV